MVRSGKRRRGSGLHSSSSLSVEPEQAPINFPPTHEAVPPLSSRHKPILKSAFQTTHFKFQINLNRPLITAHVSIILLEEENQISPLACIAPDPSQSSEHSMDKDSLEKSGQEEFSKIVQPLEDTGPVVEEGTHGIMSNPMEIPVNELDGNEILRTDSVCLVEEKNHGKIKEV